MNNTADTDAKPLLLNNQVSSSKVETETPAKAEEVKRRSDGYVESQPLNSSQINYARYLIEKSNALRDTPMRQVWPCAQYCCCCCLSKKRRSFKQGLKHSLRLKLSVPNLKSDAILENDPYLLLGYGINSYF